jgi:hypothetical protein
MANLPKEQALARISREYGSIEKIGLSDSLYQIDNTDIRIYFRYSRVHNSNTTFYGLREIDLKQLEGHLSVVCFLWNDQPEPVFIPSTFLEDLFIGKSPASDGQFKAQILFKDDAFEFYLPKQGKFNIEAFVGWREFDSVASRYTNELFPSLSHSQVQTLLGSIGMKKNYDIYIPRIDRASLDWSLSDVFACSDVDFGFLSGIKDIVSEVDVIWLEKGSQDIQAFFEVEHTTPIYSGLLRLNDILLSYPLINSRYSIVAASVRNSLFVRQVNRPTFRRSGLMEKCSFMDYSSVYKWKQNLYQSQEKL